jgi:alkanesulfonate monooxygenase SsuD/methylene tetrahydromethanopterin reductase-like flavin-dependent oxidoreductase (luciferase family)
MNDRILAACAEYDLSAWVVDHLQFDSVPLLESFSLLAHSAGRQPGVRFGTLVLGQSFRNPALTAKIATSLHFLTGGRFILGIGAGWQEAEYRAYGYPYPAPTRSYRHTTPRSVFPGILTPRSSTCLLATAQSSPL